MRLLLVLFALGTALPAFGLDIDWKLYLRAPVGSNARGGKQVVLQNPKSQGNEFRLGNEAAYGEAYFTGHLLKGGEADPFFDANLTFAYNPQMNSQYGDTTPDGDHTQVIQAFVKGGRFEDMRYSAWVGKRFYRDADLHMNDFYYFADMSGVGGGFEDISLGNGTLAVALLQQSDTSVQRTNNGAPTKQALDVRWRDIALTANDKLHLWIAAAYTSPGSGYTLNPATNVYDVPADFEASHGFAQGIRWRHAFSEKSYNNFAVIYGTGAMESLSMSFAPTTPNLNGRKRWRLVDNPVFEFDQWSLIFAFVYEDADNGGTAGHTRYYSAGVRPIYYFSDRYHLVFEAGFSSVKDDSETGTGGGPGGERTLTRFTIAPEIALAKGYLGRPVLRAYVAHTMWNGANADSGNASSLVSRMNARNNTSLIGHRDETQIGVQAEVWF